MERLVSILTYWLMTVWLIAIAPAIQTQQIPDHLVHCYRGNATAPWMPQTLQLLVELVRKIEDANPTSIDLRQLAVNLVHRLRVDGIERAASIGETDHVTPFRANGVQVAKYQVLLQLVSDTTAAMQFDRWLSPAELCHLHRMLSASVEPYERGDESCSCPLGLGSADRVASPWLKWNKVQDPFSATTILNTERVSRCPLELGVIRSYDYGTISPGTIIASIAAGVQPQRVGIAELFQPKEYEKIGTANSQSSVDGILDTVNNAYAAGLSGDLAEVCVYQGPYVGENVTVGLTGTWNNTVFPRVSYFLDASAVRWEMTDAELLAGIDGLFLSQQVSGWLRRLRRLRLSQILDMYFSSRGVPNEAIDAIPAIHPIQPRERHSSRFSYRSDISSGCHRRKILEQIDRTALRDETYNMAQVLQFSRSSLSVSDKTLRANCDATVERFYKVAHRLLGHLPTCEQIQMGEARPMVDLTLVLDGSRSEYENLEFFAFVAESIGVSNSRSQISVINGQTGQYMVRRTRSVATAFEELRNASGSFPARLSLSRSFQALWSSLSRQTRIERQNLKIAGTSHVVLVAAQKERIDQLDFESAHRMMHGSMNEFPDLYYVFLTNSPDQLGELVRGAQTVRQSHSRQEHFKVITANEISAIGTFGPELRAHLNTIPMRIMSPFCRNGSQDYVFDRESGGFVFNEDYISPNVEHRYRIATDFLLDTEHVQVTFQVNYGKATVCISRDALQAPLECRTVDESGEAGFDLVAPCPNGAADCTGVFFVVTVDQSMMRCLENRCRYPDQLLLIMRHRGLRCIPDDRSSASAKLAGLANALQVAVFVLLWMTAV